MWIEIWEEVHYTGIPCDQCVMSEDYEILDCARVNHIIQLCSGPTPVAADAAIGEQSEDDGAGRRAAEHDG